MTDAATGTSRLGLGQPRTADLAIIDGRTVEYRYVDPTNTAIQDLRDGPTQIVYPGTGRTVTRTYDAAGRMDRSQGLVGQRAPLPARPRRQPRDDHLPRRAGGRHVHLRQGRAAERHDRDGQRTTTGSLAYGRYDAGQVKYVTSTGRARRQQRLHLHRHRPAEDPQRGDLRLRRGRQPHPLPQRRHPELQRRQ